MDMAKWKAPKTSQGNMGNHNMEQDVDVWVPGSARPIDFDLTRDPHTTAAASGIAPGLAAGAPAGTFAAGGPQGTAMRPPCMAPPRAARLRQCERLVEQAREGGFPPMVVADMERDLEERRQDAGWEQRGGAVGAVPLAKRQRLDAASAFSYGYAPIPGTASGAAALLSQRQAQLGRLCTITGATSKAKPR